MKISPKETNISSIFTSSFLTIPRFQRPYSWDRENIQDFWDDVVNSKINEYFFGSMVFHRVSENSDKINVVDGQQRLTTATVFFCVIRDLLDSLGENKLAHGIQRYIERNDVNNDPSFTLISQDPYPFFQDNIQKFGSPELTTVLGEGERALKACYDYLNKTVSDHIFDLSSKKKISELVNLRDKALSIKVITVELDSEDDAYYIFETLNTRGKELGVSDLVKNHVLRFLKPKGAIDTTREGWKLIQRTIGHSISDVTMDTFITHHYISKYEYLPERKLFQSMRKTINTKENIKDYFENISNEVNLYRAIFEPNFFKWSKEQFEIPLALKSFSIFRLKQAAPFALSILAEHANGNISTKNASRFLKAIENFHFKFTAITSQRGAGGIAKMYSKAARDLRTAATENDKRKLCLELIGRFETMQPDEVEFTIGFNELYYSKEFTNQRSIVRYILERTHRHYNKNNHIDYDQMTIEHIMSQSANEAEEVKASIGNLVFVTKETNEKLKNKDFKDKIKILNESGHKYDESLMNSKKWTESEINSRLSSLATLSYNDVWRI